MAVDTGMQPLIDYVRTRGQAATAEVFDGITYWSDEQLQDDVLLPSGEGITATARPVSRYSKYVYALAMPRHYWFNTTGLSVRNADGVALTGWTYDPSKGHFTFVVEQTTTKLIVEGFCVQTYQALSLLWELKANQRSHYVNFRGGHNATYLEQEWNHCMKMQKFYASKVVKGWSRT